MLPDPKDRADELLDAVRALDPNQRREFLARMRGCLDEVLREPEPAGLPPDTVGDLAVPGTGANPTARVGRFELRDRLGEGGFGSVWRAFDPILQREVALKIADHGPADGADTANLLREARAAGQLHHPNLVPVFETHPGDGDTPAHIVLEYVPGPTLREVLREGLPPDVRLAASWVRDVAAALAYAHTAGFVHLDIKPENFILTPAGVPRLTDFGLARRLGESWSGVSNPGATPNYMSPEQARGAAPGPASDQYSLGVVLYELLTGRPPFRGTLGEVIAQLAEDDPPPPRQLVPAIPAALESICLRCLAKEPRDRYADAGALAVALTRFLESEDAPALASPVAIPLARPKSRRWPQAGLVVACAGLGLGVGGAWWHFIHPETTEPEPQFLVRTTPPASATPSPALPARPRDETATDLTELRGLHQEALAHRGRDNAEAEQLLERTVARVEAGLRRSPGSVDYERLRAAELAELGRLQRSNGRPEESRRSLEAALAGYARVTRRADEQLDMARCAAMLGCLHLEAQRLPEAEAQLRQADRLGEDAATAAPREAVLVRAEAHLGLAAVLARAGKPRPAEAACERILALLPAADRTDEEPVRQDYRAAAHEGLGSLHAEAGRLGRAESAYRRAVGLRRSVVDGRGGSEPARFKLADCLCSLGAVRVRQGMPLEALDLLDEAITLLEPLRQPGEVRHRLGRVYAERATASLEARRTAEALRDWDRALAARPGEAAWQARRALVLITLGRHHEAAGEARALAARRDLGAAVCHDVACLQVRCWEAARQGAAVVEPGESLLAGAAALLRRAREAGYFQTMDDLERLQTDPQFRPLRRREDYQEVLRLVTVDLSEQDPRRQAR